ncbi:hypothetical protein BDW74DRAFT_114954 [Aspergillus multicolor]|uniref:uncharacterized protein n=1 Tax=Aspergillus multicolor TaxID=41759 RepID=UPI003CCE3AD5
MAEPNCQHFFIIRYLRGSSLHCSVCMLYYTIPSLHYNISIPLLHSLISPFLPCLHFVHDMTLLIYLLTPLMCASVCVPVRCFQAGPMSVLILTLIPLPTLSVFHFTFLCTSTSTTFRVSYAALSLHRPFCTHSFLLPFSPFSYVSGC